MSSSAHEISHAELLAQEAQRYHAFMNLALFLSVFTGLEIVIIFTPLPYWIMMTALVSLSLIKFMCVILWFMHLIYDPPLLTILFIGGLVIAAGTMLALLSLLKPEDVDPELVQSSRIEAPAAPALFAPDVVG
jgi:cytochrome c oxidase subunit IV